jgi:hypothetical protein
MRLISVPQSRAFPLNCLPAQDFANRPDLTRRSNSSVAPILKTRFVCRQARTPMFRAQVVGRQPS